ncbi:hypothetical protein [Companilactobacillus furfuricola]|uniref:hypothetical protein n=1 Tax=Companilactobacillus furfuricola TaxID=1462575 RepID=UPI000F7AB91E|nr:hypothetical protein [Companilactobacillus furfuricola]
MKFQLKDLKSKKAITIIVVVIALIARFTIYHKHEEQNFLKDFKVTFSGNTEYGEANVSDTVWLSTYKKIAKKDTIDINI